MHRVPTHRHWRTPVPAGPEPHTDTCTHMHASHVHAHTVHTRTSRHARTRAARGRRRRPRTLVHAVEDLVELVLRVLTAVLLPAVPALAAQHHQLPLLPAKGSEVRDLHDDGPGSKQSTRCGWQQPRPAHPDRLLQSDLEASLWGRGQGLAAGCAVALHLRAPVPGHAAPRSPGVSLRAGGTWSFSSEKRKETDMHVCDVHRPPGTFSARGDVTMPEGMAWCGVSW